MRIELDRLHCCHLLRVRTPACPRFGRPQAAAWADDSIIVKELPAFKCKRCQYRFFHGSALCLHSYHRHDMTHPAMIKAKSINRAKRTLLARYAVAKRGGVYICRICFIKFTEKNQAVSHFKLRHVRSALKCPRCCEKLPASKMNRSHHCKRSWTNPRGTLPRILFCRHCPSQFRHSSSMATHYYTYHPG